MSALEVSRRERAAWSTREHVRRVAVTAFEAIEVPEPIEGFHGMSRPVLDEPLAGVRAGRLVVDVAAAALRGWALGARGAGRSWDEVGAALDLLAAAQNPNRAGAARAWLVEHRPPPPSPRTSPEPSSAVWTCTTCRARVRDTGPFAAHPDDREAGHHDDCIRHAAVLVAWQRHQQGQQHLEQQGQQQGEQQRQQQGEQQGEEQGGRDA